jgi:SIR2-like protein
MVGSGFSLNAEPLPGVKTTFPTWRQLAESMFEELHPFEPAGTPKKLEARAHPLQIASEYEAAFGRRKLDLLLLAHIPDSDYKPGRLHHLLLQLPWADVFTTNYDTLLERTEVDGRTYQPVTKANELTTAFAPRIVKLHGSFPSQTPFIVSEEDYRTYPRKFAPFVNSVRQSLIEHSFVLIGFSGDDPNFLEWTGWIRDELGGNHAPIYLVGPLLLGNAERSLLERRGVTPIDLWPLFTSVTPRNGIHADSIEWFLSSLSAVRPPRKEKWPASSRPRLSGPVLPPLAGVGPVPEDIDLSPRAPLTTEVVAKVVERWRFERGEYPGWVVAPKEKRSELWLKTRDWFGPLVNFAKNWPATDRLLLFYEINWRLETMMAPSFTDLVEPFKRTLDETFPQLMQEQAVSNEISNSAIADAWLEIAFGLLRDARETYDSARWTELKVKINEIVSRHPRFSDRNDFETALWAIWNVERSQAKAILSQWQPSPHSPLAVMRKAGLLGELDELGEARAQRR